MWYPLGYLFAGICKYPLNSVRASLVSLSLGGVYRLLSGLVLKLVLEVRVAAPRMVVNKG